MLLLLIACRTEPCAVEQGYLDLDGDGYGSEAFSGCDAPETLVDVPGDCDDSESTVHPDAVDLCDGVDLDCDGLIQTLIWWPDLDGDGFGAGEQVLACVAPDGHVDQDGDCDDTDAAAWPGAQEVWYDDVDQDCAGGDDWDQDGDGSPYPLDCDDTDPAVSPLLYEICDTGVDEDCNGLVDEDCQFFGGVAPGGAYLQINGLVASPWGEQQNTGVTVEPLGDLDKDGLPDFGVCGDTEYNGGFHVFLSSETEPGVQDLKSASIHLSAGCGEQAWHPTVIVGFFGEGQDALAFGDHFFDMSRLENGMEPTFAMDSGQGRALIEAIDLGNDGTLDLLYRWKSTDSRVYAVPGPFDEEGLVGGGRAYSEWMIDLGTLDLDVADVLGSGEPQVLFMTLTADYRGELLVVEESFLSEDLDVESAESNRDVAGYFYGRTYVRAAVDVDGDGLVDPLLYGGADRASGDIGRAVLFGSAESNVDDTTFILDMETGRAGLSPRADVALADINGDEQIDLIWGESGLDDAGAVYVILGPLQGSYTSQDAHGWLAQGQGAYDTCDEQDTAYCEHWGAGFGAHIRTLDYNGDNIDDLLIGAAFYETESPNHGPGAAFLYLGGEGRPW